MPENLSKYQSSSSSDQSIESPNLPINKSNSHGTSEETPSQASRLLFNESSTSSSPSIVKEHLLDKYTKGGSKFNIENTKKSHVNMSLRPQHKKASSPLSSPPIVRNSEQDDYFSAQSSSSTVSEVIGGNGSNAFQSSEKLQTANQLQGHDFELPDIKHIHKEHSARESYDSHKSSNSNSNYLSNVRDMMETVDFDDSTVENPRASIYSDTSPSALEEPRRAITHGFGLGNIMDGSLTSGGLAPGAIEPQSEEHHNGNKEHTQNKKRKVVTFGLSNSAPNSTLNTPLLGGAYGDDANEKDIPLVDLSEPKKDHKSKTFYEDLETVARKLVRTHTRHRKNPNDFTIPVDDFDDRHDETQYGEGSGTPPHEGIARKIGDYIAPPTHFRQGVLGSLLKLYSDPSGTANSSGTATPSCRSPSPSATPTPPDETKPKRPLLKSSHSSDSSMKWYTHKHSMSTSSVAGLLMTASSTLSAPGGGVQAMKNIRPNLNHRHSGGILPTKNKNKMKKLAEQIRITVHIADVLQRQRFVLRMCKALMLYGAPTHRLEDYLKMTSRVLELDAQFVYIPGCMIVSFADGTTHTSEVQVLRIVQGLNLYKMHKIHQIYKEVVHDVIGVEEASQRIDDLLAEKNLYPKWLCIIFYGLASAMVTPFAFSGGWLDLPISFVLGSTVGFLQIWVAPRSDLYSNVFEVASSILVSFIGRAFGSIGHNQDVFCFSAIVQGSLALILPGYMICKY